MTEQNITNKSIMQTDESIKILRVQIKELERQKTQISELEKKYDTLEPLERFGDSILFTVNISDECYCWISGKKEKDTLRDWCLENCEKGGFIMTHEKTWLFINKEDALNFEIAWNMRDHSRDKKQQYDITAEVV